MIGSKIDILKLQKFKISHLVQILQSQTSWKDFREAATVKAGLSPGSAVTFFWEGCHVEESDDKAIGLIAKDGDTFVLVPDLQSEDIGNQSAPSSSGRSGQPESIAAAETSKPVGETWPPVKAMPSKRALRATEDPDHEPSVKRERRAEAMPSSHGGMPGLPLLTTHRSQSIDSGAKLDQAIDSGCVCV